MDAHKAPKVRKMTVHRTNRCAPTTGDSTPNPEPEPSQGHTRRRTHVACHRGLSNIKLLDYEGYVTRMVPHTRMTLTESADDWLMVEAKIPPKAGEMVQIAYSNPSGS